MQNFEFHNPTKIVFGKGTIAELPKLIPAGQKILITYGGGSIKRNGVYDQVMAALQGYTVSEFGGIEPNPRYETCMKAVEQAKAEKTDLLLAVGGGSVLDGTKFIAAAIAYEAGDPWAILTDDAEVKSAVPMGSVLTLPATASEMNGVSVMSRDSTREKLAFSSPHVYPRFSILDPETTYTLPEGQVANGIVDTFVHVVEQYTTYDVNAPLQDRQAEAILLTLIDEAPKIKADPQNYETRANLMWCATQALNGLIACGVPGDWATHMIGHELTALHGLDHAQTLAIVLPALWQHERTRKHDKLVQYARRVWGVQGVSADEAIDQAIAKTAEFFQSVGVPTRLSDYDLTPADCQPIVERFAEKQSKLGEHKAILAADVEAIFALGA